MYYEDRLHHVAEILCAALWEGQYVLLVGSGLWLEVLEKTLISRLAESYDTFIKSAQVIPALEAVFLAGGQIRVVDFDSPGRGLDWLGPHMEVPSVVYLVEDSEGVNIKSWKSFVEPMIRDADVKVINLGVRLADS